MLRILPVYLVSYAAAHARMRRSARADDVHIPSGRERVLWATATPTACPSDIITTTFFSNNPSIATNASSYTDLAANRSVAITFRAPCSSCEFEVSSIGLAFSLRGGPLPSPLPSSPLPSPPPSSPGLSWPIACVPGLNCTISNYPDVCAGRGTGHEGTDIGVSASQMDAGVPVLAAADGIVWFVHDGKYDRCGLPEGAGNPDCITPESAAPGSSNGTTVCTDLGPYCGTGGGSCYWCFAGGNVVIILHTTVDGVFATRYDHFRNGSILVAPGDSVVRGQQIGLVGSAGRSTGPHLHFEVWGSEGYYSPVDPWASCGLPILWAYTPPWVIPPVMEPSASPSAGPGVETVTFDAKLCQYDNVRRFAIRCVPSLLSLARPVTGTDDVSVVAVPLGIVYSTVQGVNGDMKLVISASKDIRWYWTGVNGVRPIKGATYFTGFSTHPPCEHPPCNTDDTWTEVAPPSLEVTGKVPCNSKPMPSPVVATSPLPLPSVSPVSPSHMPRAILMYVTFEVNFHLPTISPRSFLRDSTITRALRSSIATAFNANVDDVRLGSIFNIPDHALIAQRNPWIATNDTTAQFESDEATLASEGPVSTQGFTVSVHIATHRSGEADKTAETLSRLRSSTSESVLSGFFAHPDVMSSGFASSNTNVNAADSSPQTMQPGTDSVSSDDALPPLAIAAIVVGAVVGAGILAALTLAIVRRSYVSPAPSQAPGQVRSPRQPNTPVARAAVPNAMRTPQASSIPAAYRSYASPRQPAIPTHYPKVR